MDVSEVYAILHAFLDVVAAAAVNQPPEGVVAELFVHTGTGDRRQAPCGVMNGAARIAAVSTSRPALQRRPSAVEVLASHHRIE